MTEDELDDIVQRVLAALATNSKTITQLTTTTTLTENDYFEVAGGKKVAYKDIIKLSQAVTKETDKAPSCNAVNDFVYDQIVNVANVYTYRKIAEEAGIRQAKDEELQGNIDKVSEYLDEIADEKIGPDNLEQTITADKWKAPSCNAVNDFVASEIAKEKEAREAADKDLNDMCLDVLANKVDKTSIVQTLSDSTTDVPSCKAVKRYADKIVGDWQGVADTYTLASNYKSIAIYVNKPLAYQGDIITMGEYRLWMSSKATTLYKGSTDTASYSGSLSDCGYLIIITLDGANCHLIIPHYGIDSTFADTNTEFSNLSVPSEAYNMISIRTFNCAISQDDVDILYNQGRCGDVYLGGEYRKGNELIDWNQSDAPRFSAGYGLNSDLTQDSGVIHMERTNTEPRAYYGSIYTVVDNAKLYGKCRISFDIVNPNHDVALYLGTLFGSLNKAIKRLTKSADVVHYDLDYSNTEGYMVLQFLTPYQYVGEVDYTISNLKITSVCVCDEFLPQGLLADQWINSGANGTAITLDNPTFTSQRPIIERQYCLSSATKPVPIAMGQKLYTTDTGVIYECGAKPNTSQFAISNWILISK